MDYLKRFDGIEKYLMCMGEFYVPVIYKHENSFMSNSVWVMYAKLNKDSFSKRKVLFACCGGTIENALAKFISLYDEYCVQKFIVCREWLGTAPYSLDLINEKV